MYTILSADGGGIKGVYTLKIILRLLENKPSLIDECDLFAGTSTGSIIALLLAHGLTVQEVYDFYRTCAGKVFEDSYFDDVRDLGKLLGADYDYNTLKKLLKKIVGTAKLGDLKKKVLVPTFDLDNEASESRTWKPKIFNNFQDDDLEELIADVVVRSSAAPTYFPAYQGYVDGGLVANSPALAAVCQAIDSGVPLEEIYVISLGTGYSPTFISGSKLDWGLVKWAPFLMNIVIDSMEMVTDYQCKKLLGDRYLRINSVLPEKIDLDNDNKVNTMINYADEVDLTKAFSWFENCWKK